MERGKVKDHNLWPDNTHYAIRKYMLTKVMIWT